MVRNKPVHKPTNLWIICAGKKLQNKINYKYPFLIVPPGSQTTQIKTTVMKKELYASITAITEEEILRMRLLSSVT